MGNPTDELRRRLDELDIEYTTDDSNDYEIVEWQGPYNLWWQFVYDPYEEAPYGELRLLNTGGSTHLTPEQAIAATVGPKVTEDTSDGWHSFKDLYHHRALLFSVIVHNYKDMCWKSKRHDDGKELDWNFIVGIDTPWGQASYHYGMEYWDMFDCKVLDKAPHYDGYTPEQSVERIARLVELDAATVGGRDYTYDEWYAINEAFGDAMEYAHGHAILHPDEADPLWNMDEYVNRVIEIAYGDKSREPKVVAEWRSVALGLFDSLEKADLEAAQRWLCENDLLRQEIAYGDAKAATVGNAQEPSNAVIERIGRFCTDYAQCLVDATLHDKRPFDEVDHRTCGSMAAVEAKLIRKLAEDIATVGAGTCKNTQNDFDFMCSECGKCVDNGRVLGFKFCPQCGRRIEVSE